MKYNPLRTKEFLFFFLTAVPTHDVRQRQHTVLRNYEKRFSSQFLYFLYKSVL